MSQQSEGSDLVKVRTYATAIEAELARAALEAHGVPALVLVSDAAGLLRMTEGAQLMVWQEDFIVASKILDTPPPEITDWSE